MLKLYKFITYSFENIMHADNWIKATSFGLSVFERGSEVLVFRIQILILGRFSYTSKKPYQNETVIPSSIHILNTYYWKYIIVQLTKKELQRAGGFGASVPACWIPPALSSHVMLPFLDITSASGTLLLVM